MRDPCLIMVAPNGARRTKADHPALPMTQAEIVDAVADAHQEGAQAAHLHVRDETGAHVLNAERYLRLSDALRTRCGEDLIIQITTEAVGRYTPAEQRQLVRDVKPEAVSIAYRELFAGPEETSASTDFLQWAQETGIAIQWILYAPDEVSALAHLIEQKAVPQASPILFVLGRYTAGQVSDPADLDPFLASLREQPSLRAVSWSVCAFGAAESVCLGAALSQGGNVRVGFENSLWNADGSVAVSNAQRVAEIAAIARKKGLQTATAAQARSLLGTSG